MKQIFTIVFFFVLCGSFAQIANKQTVNLYSPEADVSAAITQGIAKAKAENKHLFLQIGGNWCPWCIKFHIFCASDEDIISLMAKSYVPIMVNYSKENRNLAELKKLEYPQRFGFPVFVILDNNGKRIHTQSSAYLEEGEGYSKKKVLDFLKQWTPDALNPNLYSDK